MVRTFTPTRQYIPGGMGNSQQIHDTKYATRNLAAAVIPGATNFFGAAPSSDFTVDRYEQGNTLVSSGKVFTIVGILALLQPATGALITDLEKIINFCCLRIVTNQREFGVIPLHMVPAGGGLSAQSGQVSVTPAAAPGAQSALATTNGFPARSAGFTLAEPLDIGANQPFYMELLGPTAVTQTLSVVVGVKIILDGLEKRVAS